MPDLWSEKRRSTTSQRSPSDHRSAFDHDHDRLLFSTPVRRLADKTQVFPLDRSDAVRTRLTHSLEVSNLARSMGSRLIHESFDFPGLNDSSVVPTILATIGLAHDLGNPPFGHQGEAAIGNWFKTSGQTFFENSGISDALRPEFVEFEGNAQAFRLLTKLQVALGGYGLNWTAATLSALLKYPTSCDRRNTDTITRKKYGYFESEQSIVSWVRDKTGLNDGERHPLTWLMEAADDIAYATLDIEDAMHKGILSPDDVRSIIDHQLDGDYDETKNFITDKFKETRDKKLPISETREIMISYLRTSFIRKLIDESIDYYKLNNSAIFDYSLSKPILHESMLLGALKKTAREYVFSTADVRKIEADGFKIIGKLMDFYWYAINNREDTSNILSRRNDAKSAFGQSKLSDNYLQNAARNDAINRNGDRLPVEYQEFRLLTDMISGMTDGYAKYEYEFLKNNDFLDA